MHCPKVPLPHQGIIIIIIIIIIMLFAHMTQSYTFT